MTESRTTVPDKPRDDTAAAPLETAAVRLSRDPRGRLVFRAGADAPPVEGVRVARCFPWSLRQGHVSIRDGEGRELHLIRSLEEAEAATRGLIEAELDAQEFVPRITAIRRVDDRAEIMLWQVETDRGPIELQVAHAEDVHAIEDGRVLIKDHSGGLFEVTDPAALDARSRCLLEDHLP